MTRKSVRGEAITPPEMVDKLLKLPQLRALMSPAWAIRCAGFEGADPV